MTLSERLVIFQPDQYVPPPGGHLPDRGAPLPDNVPQTDLSPGFWTRPLPAQLNSQNDPWCSDPHCSGYRDTSDESDDPYPPREYGMWTRQSLSPGTSDASMLAIRTLMLTIT